LGRLFYALNFFHIETIISKRKTIFVNESNLQETVEKRKPSDEKRLRNGFLFLEIEINRKYQQRNTLQQQK